MLQHQPQLPLLSGSATAAIRESCAFQALGTGDSVKNRMSLPGCVEKSTNVGLSLGMGPHLESWQVSCLPHLCGTEHFYLGEVFGGNQESPMGCHTRP